MADLTHTVRITVVIDGKTDTYIYTHVITGALTFQRLNSSQSGAGDGYVGRVGVAPLFVFGYTRNKANPQSFYLQNNTGPVTLSPWFMYSGFIALYKGAGGFNWNTNDTATTSTFIGADAVFFFPMIGESESTFDLIAFYA